MPTRKDLGSILVDEDALSAKDLERVRSAAGTRSLWAALVDEELVSAEQIFRALSARFGVPVVSDERLVDVAVPEPFKRVLSRPEALAWGMLPIDVTADGQRATVVMVDPSDEATLAEFLTRAGIPEGRALLARRDPLLRAVERCLGETTMVVAPLPPPRRGRDLRPTPGPMPTISGRDELPPGGGRTLPTPPPMAAVQLPHMPAAAPKTKVVSDDDVTGTVRLDPSLQAEIQRLPARLTQADPLTPIPRPRQRRPTPPPTPAPPTLAEMVAAGETPQDALRAEERLSRALVQAVEALAWELEARLVGGGGQGAELARLARRVARQLGLGRRAADEIGVAALLFSVDRLIRNMEGAASADLFGDLGWAAAGDAGMVPILRALTAASAGFGRATQAQPTPIGARIIGAVADYLELGAATTAMPDLDTVSQLLRASPAGAQVVDALLRVLEIDRGDVTPSTPSVLPATSMLRDDPVVEDDADTPPPEPPTPPLSMASLHEEKTVRKPMPRKKEGE